MAALSTLAIGGLIGAIGAVSAKKVIDAKKQATQQQQAQAANPPPAAPPATAESTSSNFASAIKAGAKQRRKGVGTTLTPTARRSVVPAPPPVAQPAILS